MTLVPIPVLTDMRWTPDAIVLGKGPSAAARHIVLKRWPEAILVTLNHAIRWADKRKTIWAHFVDREAMFDCWPLVHRNATELLLPSITNLERKRTRLPLRFPSNPPGCIIYDRDRIGIKTFSSEGAVGALGDLGYKKVLLVGVDGGTGYAPGMEDVSAQSLAGTGRLDYDAQWTHIPLIAAAFKMEVYRA